MDYHLIYISTYTKPGGIVVSTHSTAARRRRATAARKRAGTDSSLLMLRAAIIAGIDGALRLGNGLRSLLPSGDTVRRYLAESFTLVAALVAVTGRSTQEAALTFRESALDMLSKARSVTSARREWFQRQLVYAGQGTAARRAGDGRGDAASIHRETAGRMSLAASWRLVLVECMTRIVRPDSPFEWDEYDWRHTAWGRRLRVWPGVLAGTVLLAIVLTLAFILATRATDSAQARINPGAGQPNGGTTAPSGIIVEQPAGVGSPTPPALLYQIGAWVADDSPSGPVKMYVRVSSQTKPVPNVPVTISIATGGTPYTQGPIKTDADGLAIFTLTARGGGGPVFVTATAVVGGQTLTHDVTYFPQ